MRAKWRSVFVIAMGGGEVGVIASVTQPFCRGCTRARVTANGELHTCLFSHHGHDLRVLLRGGFDDEEVQKAVSQIWRTRGDRYSEFRSLATSPLPKAEMSKLGG
jgi:cyclic pyranopterin phosphate synthase